MVNGPQTSLFDQADAVILTGVVDWLTGTLLGTIATGLSIVAIAAVGLMMLSGRLALREGARAILGCFVLFGAPALAMALRDLAKSDRAQAPATEVAVPSLPPRPPLPSSNYDPYAGASLRDDRGEQ